MELYGSRQEAVMTSDTLLRRKQRPRTARPQTATSSSHAGKQSEVLRRGYLLSMGETQEQHAKQAAFWQEKEIQLLKQLALEQTRGAALSNTVCGLKDEVLLLKSASKWPRESAGVDLIDSKSIRSRLIVNNTRPQEQEQEEEGVEDQDAGDHNENNENDLRIRLLTERTRYFKAQYHAEMKNSVEAQKLHRQQLRCAQIESTDKDRELTALRSQLESALKRADKADSKLQKLAVSHTEMTQVAAQRTTNTNIHIT